MDEFAERLGTLPDLSDEELDALEQEMVAAFDAADQAGDVESMQSLADGLDAVRAERSRRAEGGEAAPEEAVPEAPVEVAASAAVETEDAPAGAASETPEALVPFDTPEEPQAAPPPEKKTTKKGKEEEAVEPESEPAPEGEVTETPVAQEEGDESAPEEVEAPAEAPAEEGESEESESESEESDEEAEGEVEVEAESESSTPIITTKENAPVDIEVTADEVPQENLPVAASVERPMVITAGGDLPGFTAGAELSSMDEVAEAMAAKVNSIRGIGGDGEHILVASIRNRGEAQEHQTLSASDPLGNSRKIRELISNPDNLTRDALVAAGWCAPKVPIYDVPSVGVNDRPVGSSLPTFNADRGGIIWTRPPSLLAPTADAPLGVGIYKADGTNWTMVGGVLTALTDPDLKPCHDVDCGDPGEAELVALTLCLCFSNLTARAYPEWIRANTDYALTVQARMAEEYVLAQMVAASTSVGALVADNLGAARDVLKVIRTAAAEFRWNNRLGFTQPLTVVLPGWLRDAMALDLTFQAPGDNALDTSYSDVDSYFGEFNVDVIWTLDNLSAAFSSKTAFPVSANFILFSTGAFLRLDGGSLDLGIVRNKEDIQTNRYCTFTETFEEVAYIGPAATGVADAAWSYTGSIGIEVKGGVGGAKPWAA